MNDENGRKNGYRVIEWFRFITPVLISITLFMVGDLTNEIKDIDNKMFIHLTNEEIHVPREQLVNKAEFVMYSNFIDERNKRISLILDRIEIALKKCSMCK